MQNIVVNQVCVIGTNEDHIGVCSFLETGLCVLCGNNTGNKVNENKRGLFEIGAKLV